MRGRVIHWEPASNASSSMPPITGPKSFCCYCWFTATPQSHCLAWASMPWSRLCKFHSGSDRKKGIRSLTLTLSRVYQRPEFHRGDCRMLLPSTCVSQGNHPRNHLIRLLARKLMFQKSWAPSLVSYRVHARLAASMQRAKDLRIFVFLIPH